MTDISDTLRAAGARELSPGVFSLDGQMHIDAETVLVASGVRVTPETIAALEHAVRASAQSLGVPSSTHAWDASPPEEGV